MSDTQLSIASLQQSVKTLQDQVQAMQTILAKAGLMVVEQGVVGIYEGEFMVTAEGQRIQVPANYASKTMLVSGDSLRMIEGVDGGQAKFKQIGKAERLKAEGLLAKKDGKFEVLTDQGSFKVLAASVKHYELQPGDKVVIQFPKTHVRGSWAAIEKPTTMSGQTVVKPSPGQQDQPVAGSLPVMPTSNVVQIKHAPVAVESTEAKKTEQPEEQPKVEVEPSSEPKPVEQPVVKTEAAVSPKPVQAKPSNTAKSQPNRPAKPAARSGPAKPAATETRSARPNPDRSRPRPVNATKPRPVSPVSRPAGQATRPVEEQPKKDVEQSLPLDKGEIMPMVEFDDDELM